MEDNENKQTLIVLGSQLKKRKLQGAKEMIFSTEESGLESISFSNECFQRGFTFSNKSIRSCLCHASYSYFDTNMRKHQFEGWHKKCDIKEPSGIQYIGRYGKISNLSIDKNYDYNSLCEDLSQGKIIEDDIDGIAYDLKKIIDENETKEELVKFKGALQKFLGAYSEWVLKGKGKKMILFSPEYKESLLRRNSGKIECKGLNIDVTKEDLKKGFVMFNPVSSSERYMFSSITYMDSFGREKYIPDIGSEERNAYTNKFKCEIYYNLNKKEQQEREKYYGGIYKCIDSLLQDKKSESVLPIQTVEQLKNFKQVFDCYLQYVKDMNTEEINRSITFLNNEKRECWSLIRKYRINKKIEYCKKMLQNKVPFSRRIIRDIRTKTPNGLQSFICEYMHPWEHVDNTGVNIFSYSGWTR